jgi:hypothetical protein
MSDPNIEAERHAVDESAETEGREDYEDADSAESSSESDEDGAAEDTDDGEP